MTLTTADLAPPPPARQVSGMMSHLVVAHVRRHAGEEGVQRLLEEAGEDRPIDVVEDEGTWITLEQSKALLVAASQVLDDPTVGVAIGASVLERRVGGPLVMLVRALGSPSAVFRNLARISRRFSADSTAELVDLGPTRAVVSFAVREGFEQSVFGCQITMGLLSQVPVVFGLPPARVHHDVCALTGGDRCDFNVSWVKRSRLPWRARRQLHERAERQSVDVHDQLESLQDTVADLVTAGDVGTVLERVAGRAHAAVRAHRHLLVVRPREGDAPQVHAEGFAPGEAQVEAARVLLSGMVEDDDERIVAVVSSARREYGYLVAYSARGGGFFDHEHRLLRSYARYAAAALDAATALDEARRRQETATVLLDLAHKLTSVSSVEDAASELCAAVPAVVGAERSQVYLWDAATRSGRLAGSFGWPAHLVEIFESTELRLADTPEVERMLASPGPRTYDRSTGDGFIAGLMAAYGSQVVAVAPIQVRDELLGVLVADWADPQAVPVFETQLFERLASLADQGATAISNAGLLEQVTHQALHDPLTGLANRALFEDRAQQALRAAERADDRSVGMIFVDLDRFKAVNDSHGHHVGDQLLVAVAARLGEVLRNADTLARMGGDEFVVLLPEVDSPAEAEDVAARVLDVLAEPLALGDLSISIGASVGAATAGPGDTYETLLCAADAAMYQAKARARLLVNRPLSSTR